MVEITYKGLILSNKKLEQTIIEAASKTFSFSNVKVFDIAVLITNDKGIKQINAMYRHLNKATDVLSFPATYDFKGDGGFFGDIAISIATAKRQARAYNQSIIKEIAFLTIHGCLHLLGYDHTNKKNEELMRQAQRDIQEKLKETN